MSIRRDFPDLPPIWALGTAVAAWVASEVLPIWSFASGASSVLGIVAIGAGMAVVGWSALWFRRKKTSIEPRDSPRALIVEGPFRLNRNPIYSGMTLALIGLALIFGTLSAILVAAAFPFVITSRFIRGEEAALRQAFGAAAEEYFRRTRRW